MEDVRATRPHAESRDDGSWRTALLASLADTGVEPAPPIGKGRIVRQALVLGVVTLAVLGGQALFHAILNPRSLPDQQLRSIVDPIFTILTVLAVGAFRLPFVRLVRQARALKAEAALRASEARPVLYLRSFDLDARLGTMSWRQRIVTGLSNLYVPPTSEERLTKVVGRLGPVIAIGRPGETLPPLGAARFYVSNERWQDKIADIARASQVVVWVSGHTEGLRWELSHLVRSTPPSRLVLCAHPHLLNLSAVGREAEWSLFLDRFGSLFPVPLPRELGEARFFWFDEAFRPCPVYGNPYALAGTERDALAALMREKGVRCQKPGWAWRARRMDVRLGVGCLAGLFAALLLSGATLLLGISRFHPLFFTLTCAISGLFGMLFVLALPLLCRAPGGYWVGGLFFGFGRRLLMGALVTPAILLLMGQRSMWSLISERDPIPFVAAMLFPLTAIDLALTVGWVVVMMLLLRVSPYAPGRPRPPECGIKVVHAVGG